MSVSVGIKYKKFKTKNGTIEKCFGYIEGPITLMREHFPNEFEGLAALQKKKIKEELIKRGEII